MLAPRFTHDCDCCEHLGAVDGTLHDHGDGIVQFDLYYCPRSDEGSLIARYGSEGSHYVSYPVAIARRCIQERHVPHLAITWALHLLDAR